MAVLFLQSGIDKVTDRKGNLAWLKEHFASTFLSGQVGLLLLLITLLELSAGFLSALGIVYYLFQGSFTPAYLGALLCAISVLCLFAGQRIAKDYEGAGTLAVYFLLILFGLYLFSMP